MPLDSESRWRLVRKNRNKPAEPQGELVIRDATEADLIQVTDSEEDAAAHMAGGPK